MPRNVPLVYTDRVDGSDFNRVAALDGRLVLGSAYALTFQGGGSAPRAAGATAYAFFFCVNKTSSGRP